MIAKNNTWLCVLTTGPGSESQKGQHIVASISSDKGCTWSSLINIEPSDAPPSSWATPYVTSYGRIYVFYDYNGDNINMLKREPLKHNTELGWYCYKYSDDGRYRVTGWNWFDPKINDVNGTRHLNILSDFNCEIEKIRIYNRYLSTSEAISNYYGTRR